MAAAYAGSSMFAEGQTIIRPLLSSACTGAFYKPARAETWTPPTKGYFRNNLQYKPAAD
jgi:hypothetical protein